MKLQRIVQLVFVIGAFTLINGCGSKDDSNITSNFSSIYTNLLSTTCMSCHIPGGVATADGANFDLSSQSTAYTTLTGNNFGGVSSSGCGGFPLVEVGSASTSGLEAVLFQDVHDSFGCTTYATHLSDQNISTAERTAITEWINNGAQND